MFNLSLLAKILILTGFRPELSECGEQPIPVLLLTNLHLFEAICHITFNPSFHYTKQFSGVFLWSGAYLCSIKLWLWLGL